MNKTALIATVVALAGAAYYKYHNIHENIIVDRFPDLDPTVVRKAYQTMLKRAYAGAYSYTDNSEETMDKIFLAIVKEQTAK